MTTIKQRHEMDMLHGPLFGRIIRMTLPIIISSLLQLLFNAADLVVVGRFDSHEAVGAVGANSSLIALIVALFTGLSVGSGVCVAVALGARQEKKVSDCVHTAITTALISGTALAVLGWFCAPTFLQWMNVDPVLLPNATLYLRIYLLGSPLIMLYNFGFSIMRTLGDTRRPLYYMTLAGLVNIGLNLLLVIEFNMSAAGVAIATVISLSVAALLVTRSLMRYDNACRLTLSRLRIVPSCLWEILCIGVPAGMQGILFGISNTMLQTAINSFGAAATSGCAAASSLEGFAYVTMNSFSQTATTFAGQNYGARKYRRVLRSMWLCLTCAIIGGFLISGLLLLLREPLLSFYLPDAPEAFAFATERLKIVLTLYFIDGIMEVLTGSMRGFGVSFSPMVVTVFGICVLRIFWIQFVFSQPAYHSIGVLYYSYPISWAVSSFFLALLFLFWFPRRCPRAEEAVEEPVPAEVG